MNTRTRRKNGYTFAEVLMAAGLLGVMFGGTVRLIGTMNVVEATAGGSAVGMNILDAAAKLWQLGLSPAEALSVLPITTNNEILDRAVLADGSGNTVAFSAAGTTTLPNSMGTLEHITISVTVEDPQGANHNTTSATVYRPTAR